MAPVDAQNSAIPGAISSKIGENLSEIRPNCHVNFMLIGKAPAEKSEPYRQKDKNKQWI